VGVLVLAGIGGLGISRHRRAGRHVPRWVVPMFGVCIFALVVLGLLRN
jgi:uncharacterized membrane protein